MLQIGIVIFDEAEVLDFAGPYEVFATAARLCDAPPWRVSLISEKTTVMARGGFPVQSHFTLANHPPLDVLLVSGGVLVLASVVLEDYPVRRLLVFVDEETNTAASYNLEQAEVAIGNGGLTGRGLFQGTQNNSALVPEQQTDFIFTVVAEETGFVGLVKSVNGGVRISKKGFMLTGKLKPIDVERQQHQQVHPSLMYGQFG